MEIKKFLLLFFASVVVYFVLDYVFRHAMLYIMGGIVGGSIGEAFKAIGIKAGTVLICLIWTVLLIGLIVLFYRLSNNVLKYVLIFMIASLLYVIDMFFANISYSESAATERAVMISTFVVGGLILIKSLILSVIIYTGIIKN